MPTFEKTMQNVGRNPLPWLVQAFASVFFVGNLYMATQLFPLIRNIDSLVSRVNAIEQLNEANLPYVVDYIQFKTSVSTDVDIMKEDLKEIKDDIKALGRVHGLQP